MYRRGRVKRREQGVIHVEDLERSRTRSRSPGIRLTEFDEL
jgi:hypothetical protein